MQIKTVGQLMIGLDHYPHLNHRATLGEAIELFVNAQLDVNGRRSLPRVLLVFDDIDQLVGQVRRRDILRGLEPQFLSTHTLEYRRKWFDVEPDPNLTVMLLEKFISGMAEKLDQPIIEVMSPIPKWVGFDEQIGKVIYEVVAHDTHLVPVVKDNRVVGVVRTVDLMGEVHRLIEEQLERRGKPAPSG